jgi:hypothetical protein
MKRVLLYYPSIDFPNKSWLYKAILYSDAIGTIVPFEAIADKKWKIPDETKFLFDEGEYQPYFIRKYIDDNRQKFENYVRIYSRFFQSPNYRELIDKSNFDLAQIIPNSEFAFIHSNYSGEYFAPDLPGALVVRRDRIKNINNFDDLTKLRANAYKDGRISFEESELVHGQP